MKRIALLLIVLSYQPIWAHPHAWVGLTTDFVINTSGVLTEIRQRWVFDPYYSALTIDDLNKEFSRLDEGLAANANDIVNNLKSVNYYSHLYVNNDETFLLTPRKYQMSTISVQQDTLLLLEMHFSISTISMEQVQLYWQVYDPTYYVAMMHDSLQQIRIYNSSTLECEAALVNPDPDSDVIDFAASLDKTQTNSDGLGKFFAQMVTLTCL